jgi:hypothetical protein
MNLMLFHISRYIEQTGLQARNFESFRSQLVPNVNSFIQAILNLLTMKINHSTKILELLFFFSTIRNRIVSILLLRPDSHQGFVGPKVLIHSVAQDFAIKIHLVTKGTYASLHFELQYDGEVSSHFSSCSVKIRKR